MLQLAAVSVSHCLLKCVWVLTFFFIGYVGRIPGLVLPIHPTLRGAVQHQSTYELLTLHITI